MHNHSGFWQYADATAALHLVLGISTESCLTSKGLLRRIAFLPVAGCEDCSAA